MRKNIVTIWNETKRSLVLEISLGVLVLVLTLSFISDTIIADVGENVTVGSSVEVGSSEPNIINISLSPDPIILTPNATTTVLCIGIIEDYDGDTDVGTVNATYFDTGTSSYELADDKNNHYTNVTCTLNYSYGDTYQVESTCAFEVEYFAEPGTWNCTLVVEDLTGFIVNDTNGSVMQTLLAVGLPESIDYGIINATYVSDEKQVNITNYGNVLVNLSLSGYGGTEGDDQAMNCAYGSLGYIPLEYEKFNLTQSVSGPLTLSEFEVNYTNLSNTPTVQTLYLPSRTNDAFVGDGDYNTSYWRIYVPPGVAGDCNGSIIFGATQAVGA